MFWDKFVNIKSEKACKIISFISHYLFYIYFFHMRAIEFVHPRLASIVGSGNLLADILLIVISFVVSLITAIGMDFLLKPIQKVIDKVWVIK